MERSNFTRPPLSTCQRICRLCGEIAKWTPVLIISTIVGWSYYAYVIAMCFFSVNNNVEKAIYLIFYHPIFLIFLWTYIKTIFTAPISPPRQFYMNYEESERLLSTESEADQKHILELLLREKQLPIETRANNGIVRICDRCHLIKPDRAHHCSTCGCCLLKMDHHCPWVNNCVGFHNYKFFVIFLGYGCIYCLYVSTTSLKYFIDFWTINVASGNLMRFHILFLFFASSMFAISLLALCSYHLWLTLKNRSTLESFRTPTFRSGPDKDGFNLGKYRNFKEVFGENCFFWFLPIFSSGGDGVIWETRTQNPSNYIVENGQGSGLCFPVRVCDTDAEGLLSSRLQPDEESVMDVNHEDQAYNSYDRVFNTNERYLSSDSTSN